MNMTCTAEAFVGTNSSGSVFSCDAQNAACFDVGGACGQIGRNGSGYITFGDGCTPTLQVGDSLIISGANVTNNNGAFNCDGSCQIRDSGNGTLPINTTGGVVLNSTSAITGFILVDVVVDLASIAASTCDDVTATVAGVEANDGVFVTPASTLDEPDVTVGDAHVTNAGTDEVTFRACNISSGGAEDPSSATFRFWVVRKA